MASGVINEPDAMEDFRPPRSETFDLKPGDPLTRDVYISGQGPAVIIIHEIPGITPEVLRFARWVRDAGFRIYLPHLFGEPGRPNSKEYVNSSIGRVCIAREFEIWLSSNSHSPVIEWLKQLAAKAHGECGGKGVGALGMCITGNFALSMMVEPAVRAPVLCQPSVPILNAGGIHASRADIAAVRARLEAEDLTVKAYRFKGDKHCKSARFRAFEKALGSRFDGDELEDIDAKPGTFSENPHSVVTTHLINEDGSVTMQKVRDIIAFFKTRLV